MVGNSLEFYPLCQMLIFFFKAPPELVLGDEINYPVGSEVDLWSLGCIILECAVWISLGERGRLDFIEGRTAETDLLSDYAKSGRGDCFHDGRDLLRCVRGFGQHIRDHGRRDDEITSKMFNLATRELLVEKDKRQFARHIYSAMKSIIDTEAHRRRTSLSIPTNGVLTGRHGSITGQPVVASPTAEQEYVSSYTPHLGLEARSPVSGSNLEMPTAEQGSSRKESPAIFPTIDQVSKWIERKKINGNTPELPGWESVQAQLNGRDFVSGNRQQLKTTNLVCISG
jgi:serine/threonine protein kinase